MNFPSPNSDHRKTFSAPKQPQLNLQQALTTLQSHCSNFLNNLSHIPNPNSLKTHLQSSLSHLQNQAKIIFPGPSSSSSSKIPLFARVSGSRQLQSTEVQQSGGRRTTTKELIDERLEGVPVYALKSPANQLVFISSTKTHKSLGIFCFKKEDAEACLEDMKLVDPEMPSRYEVVPFPLNKLVQLKSEGLTFRLVPESSQVEYAIKEREKAGMSQEVFAGVPVFQSRSLTLRVQNDRYRPVFFRKEDLLKSLARTAQQQNRLNPALRHDAVEVAVLEDIIKGMKESPASEWNDVVFVPPGYEVPALSPKQ